jgi:hypothetical protein
MFQCFGYFWLLIGFTDSNVTIPSDSNPYKLLVISEPSDAISTLPMLPLLIPYLLLPFKKREILCTSLPRSRKTSYHFDLTHTVFLCVIIPCPLYIDLDTPHSTSLYCILLIILCFSSCFISFAPISLDLSLLTSDYVYKSPHSFTYHYLIYIELYITPFTPLPQCTFATGTDLPGLRTFRSFKFPTASII